MAKMQKSSTLKTGGYGAMPLSYVVEFEGCWRLLEIGCIVCIGLCRYRVCYVRPICGAVCGLVRLSWGVDRVNSLGVRGSVGSVLFRRFGLRVRLCVSSVCTGLCRCVM